MTECASLYFLVRAFQFVTRRRSIADPLCALLSCRVSPAATGGALRLSGSLLHHRYPLLFFPPSAGSHLSVSTSVAEPTQMHISREQPLDLYHSISARITTRIYLMGPTLNWSEIESLFLLINPFIFWVTGNFARLEVYAKLVNLVSRYAYGIAFLKLFHYLHHFLSKRRAYLFY